MVLGCVTGFRIQELLSITVSQVWDGFDVVREVAVSRRDLKGGRGLYRRSVRSRRVPLAEPVREAIRQSLGTVDTDNPNRGLFATSRSHGAGMNRVAGVSSARASLGRMRH